MAENENKVKKGTKVHPFFKSKAFSVILTIALSVILEFVSAKLFTILRGERELFDALFNHKPFQIYYIVCIILSLSVFIAFNRELKKSQNSGTPGVIRIMTQRQHDEEKFTQFLLRICILAFLLLALPPFIAPIMLSLFISLIVTLILSRK